MNRKFLWSLLLILVLTFVLRVFRLDAQSLWWDEIAPILIARLPFPQWLIPVFQDRGHPPGLYFFLSLWMPSGLDEFYVRFLSVIEGTLSVAILARLGARIGGARVGIIAALLMALSPFYIWYAQESRMYAPLILAAVASSWAFVELIHRPRASVAVGLFFCNVFGLYSHYLFGLFLLTQLLFLVMARGKYPRTLRFVMLATFGAGIVFAPWLIALQLMTIQGRPNLDWIPNAQWFDPLLSLFSVLLGASADPNFLLNWLTPLCALAVAVFGVVVYGKTRRENVRWLLMWLVVPWFFIFLLSLFVPGRSLYVDRYLTPFVPALLLLIALGANALYERKRVLLGALAIVAFLPILFSLLNMYWTPRYARDDWRSVTTYLHQNANTARDVVLLDLGLMLPFDLYQQDTLPRIQRPFSDSDGDSVVSWANSPQNVQGHEHVWLVTTAIPINVHRFYPDEQGQRAFAKQDAFKKAMDSRYQVLNEHWFSGLVLTEYQVTP